MDPQCATPLSRHDPEVCPARYGSNYYYWGDFFGFRYVPVTSPSGTAFTHVAIYSSDEHLGCHQTNIYQGQELHLQAWPWPG